MILVNRKLNVGNYKNLVSTRESGRVQRVVSFYSHHIGTRERLRVFWPSGSAVALRHQEKVVRVAVEHVTAQVEELLISPNDYFTIKALVSERQGGVSVTARIIGVERVVYVKESLIKRGTSLLAVGLGGLLLGIVSNWLTFLTTLTKWKAHFYYTAFGAAVNHVCQIGGKPISRASP